MQAVHWVITIQFLFQQIHFLLQNTWKIRLSNTRSSQKHWAPCHGGKLLGLYIETGIKMLSQF
jgi:hypothetical protein